MGGYLKSKGEPGDPAFVDVELDFSFCGPFTEADPTCASGTTIHEALTPYDVGGWDQYEVGIVTIDAASGAAR